MSLFDPFSTAEFEAGELSLTQRHEDFMMLTVLMLAQYGAHDRANILVEALIESGVSDKRIQLCHAILQYFLGNSKKTLTALEALDAMDPMEHLPPGRLSESQRLRRYLRARCHYDLLELDKAKKALALYLQAPMTPIGSLPPEESKKFPGE